MDLTERIDRRRTRNSKHELVVDPDSLNPVVHPTEPVGRETLFEALLDAIDPLFEQAVPPNVYVWGPSGSGKSAIVTALMSALETKMQSQRPFYAATRGQTESDEVEFAYLDARQATSRFQLYRELLDGLLVDAVPERGMSTDALERKIRSIQSAGTTVVVAVDHLQESMTADVGEIHRYFEPFENLAWLGVGRTPPEDVSLPIPEQQVHVPAYGNELVDTLTVRGSRGLSHTLDHRHAQRLAEWAEGDAHDALAALYVAARTAERADATRLRDEDVEAGIDAVPRDGVPIGQVLALSENEHRILERLLALERDGERPIERTAELIAEQTEFTPGTVKRRLYELAQFGVLKRQEVTVGPGGTGNGRRPSGVTPNFSATLFTLLRE
ncbi:MAG: Cdc6/Cdc18 family protein [Halobellus sp.]